METNPPDLSKLKKEDLLRDFESAWAMTEILFSSLRCDADFLVPPEHGLRHPLIFYYGHAPVFYVNKLLLVGMIPAPLDEEFERLFAIGVDEHSWDDMSKNASAWPSLDAVREYRARVYALVRSLLETKPELSRGGAGLEIADQPVWAIAMGIEHERIHIETTSVLLRELDLARLQKPDGYPALHPSASRYSGQGPKAGQDFAPSEWLEVESGEVQIGKPADWPIFGWDNEYGKKHLRVPAFSVQSSLASNGELFSFVEAGGYRDETLWTHEGWSWRTFRKAKMPRFWVTRESRFYLRTLFEEIPLPWSWPAVLNFHEAQAYANWRAREEKAPIRLLREGEHHRLRAAFDPQIPRYSNWYESASSLERLANFNLRHGSEGPVVDDPGGAGGTGRRLSGVFGNLWQWCEDIFEPLEGFKTHPLYEDYSVPSFDGRHQLLLGGSFISTGEATSPWTRNNFRRHFFQHAGVRLVRSL